MIIYASQICPQWRKMMFQVPKVVPETSSTSFSSEFFVELLSPLGSVYWWIEAGTTLAMGVLLLFMPSETFFSHTLYFYTGRLQINTYLYIYTYLHMFKYIFIYIYTHFCRYVYVYIYIYIFTYMHVYIYIYININMYVYACVCMYTCKI